MVNEKDEDRSIVIDHQKYFSDVGDVEKILDPVDLIFTNFCGSKGQGRYCQIESEENYRDSRPKTIRV